MKEAWWTPLLQDITPPRLSYDEVRQIRREVVSDAQALKVAKTRRAYEAQGRSGWDTYDGAITAARAGNASRLIDLLRAGRQLGADDCERLTGFIVTKLRRRTWPPWLEQALKATDDAHDRLADLIEQIGRRQGCVSDEPAHRAAKMVLIFVDVAGGRLSAQKRDEAIERACHIIEDEERCPAIDRERVRNLLDHPWARMDELRRDIKP